MADYIDRQAIRDAMYHEAFETDSDMQRWDSGCWIRYKMFENVIDRLQSADAVEVVRCRDCKYYALAKNGVNGICIRQYGSFNAFDFCSYGERK